ncbi:recombinase family protein [Pseudovibrio sp. Tun.PSC04-5.I4]|uniref:recombinase family protein n=1 Tax=Pseudovibrio sp. Tun.PSC04-5.I4 TaxID=1798213 RepID=UPI000ABFD019|nr:recombinase family protein [Pseudovibrio sp. Tun.PSC04-5.I4]
MQEQALSDAGCEEILADRGVWGNAVVKPQLARLLDKARDGDTIVVWRLDRLSRSLQDLLALMEDLQQRGLHLHSIKQRTG